MFTGTIQHGRVVEATIPDLPEPVDLIQDIVITVVVVAWVKIVISHHQDQLKTACLVLNLHMSLRPVKFPLQPSLVRPWVLLIRITSLDLFQVVRYHGHKEILTQV